MVLHVSRITSTSIDVMKQTLKTDLYPKLPVYSVFVSPPPTTGGCLEGLSSFFFSFFFVKYPCMNDN